MLSIHFNGSWLTYNFMEKTFAGGFKFAKFMKVFSLESFLLYSTKSCYNQTIAMVISMACLWKGGGERAPGASPLLPPPMQHVHACCCSSHLCAKVDAGCRCSAWDMCFIQLMQVMIINAFQITWCWTIHFVWEGRSWWKLAKILPLLSPGILMIKICKQLEPKLFLVESQTWTWW